MCKKISLFCLSTRGFARVEGNIQYSELPGHPFSCACISNTRGDHHLRQLQNKSFHSKDHPFRARIVNTEMTIFSSSHTSIFILATLAFVSVFQTLEMTIEGSQLNVPFIPRTPVFARVFQTLEMTIFGSIPTSIFIPRTPAVRVFQTLEVTMFGSFIQVSSHQRHPFSCAYFKHPS